MLGPAEVWQATRKHVRLDRSTILLKRAPNDGPAYGIVRRVGPPVSYDLEGPTAGMDCSVSLGFEAWRQLHVEKVPRTNESGTHRRIMALFVNPANDNSDVRKNIYEADGHVREVDFVKGSRVPPGVKKAMPMQILFEELGHMFGDRVFTNKV